MAGLADLLNMVASPYVIHSAALFSAESVAGTASLIPRKWEIAYCDAKYEAEDDWQERWVPNYTEKVYVTKTYTIELKPLFSAFRPKAFATTTIRALLINFIPILEAYMKSEDDEDDDAPDTPDLKAALRRSGTHALREVSVVTVRRVLERIVVHMVSARTAWKLLKDVPKSAARKARRDITRLELFTGVARTTFRAHLLGVGANWLVQEVMDVYRSGKIIYYHRKSPDRIKGRERELEVLYGFGRRTAGNTLKAFASLSLASVGAGLGAILITPHTGTWIGLAIGDTAGIFLVGFWLDAWIYNTSLSS